MGRVEMDAPPALPHEAVYAEYMPWLLRNFFDRTCAYCLARHPVVTEREMVLAPLLRDLAESWLFFHAFDIPVASHVRDRIMALRKSAQAKLW